MRKLIGRYEELARVSGTRSGSKLLATLKDHAQELANTSLLDRIQELKVVSELLPAYEYHCRK